MSAEELQTVRGMLADTELALAGPVETARANFEATFANLPVAEDIAFRQEAHDGVPVLVADDPRVGSGRTLLYLHGGGFAAGSAHSYRSLWSELARAADARGIGVDYRLAPEHPYPAAVDDALGVYRALIAHRDPSTVAIVGDSAGGGLAISLLVAARQERLPMPGAVVCLSPWVDLRCSGPSYREKAAEDLSLVSEELVTLAARYADGRAAEPLASPVAADLTGLPPLLIQVGSAEILFDDAIALARRAGAAAVPTTLELWPEMPHVWHSFAFMLGEGAQATAAAAAFIHRHTEGGR